MTTDPSSASNPAEVALEHLSLTLDVEFASSTLRALASWRGRVAAEQGAAAVVLDAKKLAISAVLVNGEAVAFTLSEESEVFGCALNVPLPEALRAHGSRFELQIHSEAGPSSSAVQWLPAEQTAGKVHPYLFTQCQAIHARALLPCMDTPSAKYTFEAAVRVPSWATALMGAQRSTGGAPTLIDGGARREFRFEQPMCIPSYLLAVAVGELEGRPIGPRSTAWAEPSVVAAVTAEFGEDTEKFLLLAEEIAAEPYAWGIYDVLCLPPSFPYGGMENPCLTFVTPTLLAGDRSLVGVIAHEIAHSWTGNLVTNATWEHFWLNEGWTVWLERNLVTRAGGDPRLFGLHALSGLKALREDIAAQGGETSVLTKLVPDLSGQVDPDDAFSRVPYEKGFNLLLALADALGGDATMLTFFRAYVKHFKGRTLTSSDFTDFACSWAKGRGRDAEVAAIDWQAWLHTPGMPPTVRAFDPSLGNASAQLAEKWATGKTENCTPAEVSGWSSLQRQVFLDGLLDHRRPPAGSTAQPSEALDDAALRRLGELYAFGKGQGGAVNCEEAFRFYRLCLAAAGAGSSYLPEILSFVKSNGRMKYVRPLYRDLCQSEEGRAAALPTFQAWRVNYHPIAQHMLALDLGLRS
ncbi:peptidase family M1-domain-containing protein [Pavlovales sp. CCMP2436]|nr:peptidase family M1-domain-containing protein [Pavlovales sp. CCMP2436]